MRNLKKHVRNASLLLVLGLGVQLSATAQEAEFGVKAGALYNMPSYGSSVSSSDSKFGAQAGVFVRTTAKVYLEGELAFSTFKSSYTYEQKKFNPTFYQLNLPLQVGYRLVDTEQMTLRASVGPQVNFNLKKNQATTNADFKPFTFDGLVNIGTDFDRFSVDLRYNHTINKTSAELDSRNRMVGLSVGYRF
jgi:hypothetical protein